MHQAPSTETIQAPQLDQWQIAAVRAPEAAVVVRAQVGSGKTTVLVQRALWLAASGIPLKRIALLTFTNRAAEEMKARLAAPNVQRGQQPWLFGTFHSVARALLARALPVQALGFPQDFRILDSAQREAVWRQLMRQHGLNVKYEARLERRVESWRQGQPLFGAMKKPDQLGELLELAEIHKRQAGWMDFDDLLAHATTLLNQQPLSEPPFAVLVDELQDCDDVQLDFVRALCAQSAQFFGVGDPNQSIYGWRGASEGAIDRAISIFGAAVYALPMNYRSAEPIVASARTLLIRPPIWLRARGPADPAQALVASRGAGPSVQIVRHANALAEARYVASKVAAAHREGVPLPQVAIVARTRRQLGPIAEALKELGLPVVAQSQPALRDSEVVRWLIDALMAALHPRQSHALLEALVHPRFGLVQPRQLGDVRSIAASETPLAFAAEQLRAAAQRARSKGHELERAAALVECLPQLSARLAALPLEALSAEFVLESSHLLAWLVPTSAHYDAAMAEVWRATQAICALAQHEGVQDEGAALAAPALAQAVAAASALPQVLGPNQAGEGVRLLTMHASKGLEFDEVFAIGVNDGILPLGGRGPLSPQALEEEQRLLFVAVSRARERLEISWSLDPQHPQGRDTPSPFLRLLPKESCEWHHTPPELPEDAPAKSDPPAAVASHAADPFSPGNRVRHPRYGEGVIQSNDGAQIVCEFKKFGTKSFQVALCPLLPC